MSCHCETKEIWILKISNIHVDLISLWLVRAHVTFRSNNEYEPNQVIESFVLCMFSIVNDLHDWCYYLYMILSLLISQNLVLIVPYRPSYHKYLVHMFLFVRSYLSKKKKSTIQSSINIITGMSKYAPTIDDIKLLMDKLLVNGVTFLRLSYRLGI